MKKFFVGIAFFCFAFFAKGAENVQATVTDVSDNFVSLNVNKKKYWFNDDFVHVQAKFSDKKQAITANSVMRITWENTRDTFLQEISESGKLVIQDEERKDHEVGHYTVDKDGVVVLFNDQVEKFKDVAGQIDFDLQVKSKSEKNQDLIIQAGNLTSNLRIVGQNRLVEDIGLVEINGNYASNDISWEIGINPDKTDYAQIEVENIIPEGLILDEKSLNIKIANREIKVDKNNFQIDGNKLKLIVDGKKYPGFISISYDTQVKDSAALNALNQVTVRYQLTDDKKINERIYGGKIQNELVKNIIGKAIEKQTDLKKEDQTKKDDTKTFLDRLAALIAEKKKSDTESERKEQNKNKDSKDISTPTVTGLTGFDNKPTEITTPKANKNTNKDFKTVENKILKDSDEDDDLEDISLEKNKHRRVGSRTASTRLPKAGESASIIWSIAGLLILIVGTFTLSLKIKNR